MTLSMTEDNMAPSLQTSGMMYVHDNMSLK